jgi:transcriptional regulator with XRE-family HTH domain
MSEQELVKKCLLKICARLGFGDTVMTQREYELLSGEIEEKTGILISVSTIRRLLNGEFSRMPQAATLNAISGYLGYKNWYEYKSEEKNGQSGLQSETINGNGGSLHKKPLALRKWKWAAAIILAMGIIVLAGFLTQSSTTASNFEKAGFSAKKTTSNDLPNTVVFNYNIDVVNADSFFIQQSWDENRRVRIYKNNYTLTDIYYEPGYHVAKLIANNQVIKTFDVSIPTDRWFFYAKEKGTKTLPQYIEPAVTIKNGILLIDTNDLAAERINSQVESNYVYAFFPTKLEVSSDNYVFKARVRVKEVRNNFCPALMCEIFSQHNFMFFKSTLPGCASESSLQFGEHFVSGKRADLSPISFDISQWTDVEIRVKDKKVTIFLNGKEVYATSYIISSGLITGLGFISNGLCEVDAVELKGLDGKVVYSNEF